MYDTKEVSQRYVLTSDIMGARNVSILKDMKGSSLMINLKSISSWVVIMMILNINFTIFIFLEKKKTLNILKRRSENRSCIGTLMFN